MRPYHIIVDKGFWKQAAALDQSLQKKLHKTFLLFQENPLHPSLRFHQLQGKMKGFWSIFVDRRYRVIMELPGDGTALFISVGTHAIYE